MLSRVADLTSRQIADCIVATDLAAHLDSLGYFSRRISWTDKLAADSTKKAVDSADKGREC